MKFPKVTVILVLAALAIVAWEQFRQPEEPIDPGRFANVAANPVERSVVIDWVITQIPAQCEDATGQPVGTDVVSQCIERSEKRSSSCRRAMYDRFPDTVASDATFRDLTLTAMDCLVPQSERIGQTAP